MSGDGGTPQGQAPLADTNHPQLHPQPPLLAQPGPAPGFGRTGGALCRAGLGQSGCGHGGGCARGKARGRADWLDWTAPARHQHLPIAMHSCLIGAEGMRRLNCSCPSKESESYRGRTGGTQRSSRHIASWRCPPQDPTSGWQGGTGAARGRREAELSCQRSVPSRQPWHVGSVVWHGAGLTHVSVGDLCRAQAARGGLGAAGGAVLCGEGQGGHAARPPGPMGGEVRGSRQHSPKEP